MWALPTWRQHCVWVSVLYALLQYLFSFDCTNCNSRPVLVLVLFLLNLTVTDGTINVFILYANIISINTPVFFIQLDGFVPAYTFISLVNLDLGIQSYKHVSIMVWMTMLRCGCNYHFQPISYSLLHHSL